MTLFIFLLRVMISASAYNIGDIGPSGGFIFYVDPADNKKLPAGFTYLEAAPVDQAKKIAWSNITYERIGTTSNELGAGPLNTELIVSQPGHMTSSARKCKELEINGLRGWFLPSKDELDIVYKNLCEKGLGGFSYMGTYWSSSEGPTSGESAWAQQFYIDGFQDTLYKHYKVMNVRCVRAF